MPSPGRGRVVGLVALGNGVSFANPHYGLAQEKIGWAWVAWSAP
jgi:hypothetical protein